MRTGSLNAMRASQERPPRTATLSSPTLIGRDDELALLREATSIPPAVVLVDGEAGVGKSRLVREIAHVPDSENRRTLLGHCHRLREPFLLGPVVEALRDAGDHPPRGVLGPVVGALRPLLPELAGVLPPEPPPLWDARAERHRVFRALRELLGAFGPTLCVLEDLHWADEGTLEFLSFLLSRPPPELALVVTYRTEELPAVSPLPALRSLIRDDTVHLAIELPPLTVDGVSRLVCAILETDAISGEFARELHQRTAGIPFAVEEVLRLLRDQGQLHGAEGQPVQAPRQFGVPRAIAQSIRERMRKLDRDARLLTECAAVLAVSVDEELLTTVAGLPSRRAMSGLTQALSPGVLEEKRDGRFGFRHALAAEAVHADIAAPERRRLHLRAARALESAPEPRPLGRLAHHFKEAKHGRWTHYAEEAADAATSVGNDREAARLLEDTLSAPSLSRTARIRMATKLGAAALYSVSPRGASMILQRVLNEQSMPASTRGELRLALSRLQSHAGDSSWREQMIRAVDELQPRPELAARAMATLAWPTTLDGPVEENLGWLRRAVEAAASTDDPMVKSFVDLQRAAILLLIGDPDGWSAVGTAPERPESIEQKVQLLRGYHNLSVTTLGLGHYGHAERFLAEVCRLNDELGHAQWNPWLESTRIGVDWRVGRWEGLESRAYELMQSTLARPALSLGNQLILGKLLLVRGRVKEAERTFATALELAEPRRWMSAQVVASTWLARIHFARGEVRRARERVSIGLDLVMRKGTWLSARELAPVAMQVLVAAGVRDEARKLAKDFAAGLLGRDAPAARAASAFCNGILAEAESRHEAGARLLGRADRLWRELPCPYEAAQAREVRARCLLARHDRRAGDLLLDALETFDSLGASWDAGRVRATLRVNRLPLGPPSRRARRPYGNELSPREAQVAQLAGMGRKNREIAETLFLSTRTIEVHIASVLRKLGVHSRRELSRHAEARARREDT